MKPAPFAWHTPATLQAALALKAAHGEAARFLAGGQSLVPAMNFRVAQPAVLIDLNRVAGLDQLALGADGALRIGASAGGGRCGLGFRTGQSRQINLGPVAVIGPRHRQRRLFGRKEFARRRRLGSWRALGAEGSKQARQPTARGGAFARLRAIGGVSLNLRGQTRRRPDVGA